MLVSHIKALLWCSIRRERKLLKIICNVTTIFLFFCLMYCNLTFPPFFRLHHALPFLQFFFAPWPSPIFSFTVLKKDSSTYMYHIKLLVLNSSKISNLNSVRVLWRIKFSMSTGSVNKTYSCKLFHLLGTWEILHFKHKVSFMNVRQTVAISLATLCSHDDSNEEHELQIASVSWM